MFGGRLIPLPLTTLGGVGFLKGYFGIYMPSAPPLACVIMQLIADNFHIHAPPYNSDGCPPHLTPSFTLRRATLLQSKLICTTEEGEILLADWRARVGANSGRGGGDDEAGGGGNEGGDGGDVAPEFVKWVSSDHTRPCVALDKSPFFPGVLLSVGDWSFQIWKVNK